MYDKAALDKGVVDCEALPAEGGGIVHTELAHIIPHSTSFTKKSSLEKVMSCVDISYCNTHFYTSRSMLLRC